MYGAEVFIREAPVFCNLWRAKPRLTSTAADGIANGYLVASPLGFDDDGTSKPSWNGAGTADIPRDGRTCHDPSGAFAHLCYSRSCGPRGGCNNSCYWTTCEDSVQQALWASQRRALACRAAPLQPAAPARGLSSSY